MIEYLIASAAASAAVGIAWAWNARRQRQTIKTLTSADELHRGVIADDWKLIHSLIAERDNLEAKVSRLQLRRRPDGRFIAHDQSVAPQV